MKIITKNIKIATPNHSKPLPSSEGIKDKKYGIKKGDKIENKPNRMYFLIVVRFGLERFLIYRKKVGVGVFSL